LEIPDQRCLLEYKKEAKILQISRAYQMASNEFMHLFLEDLKGLKSKFPQISRVEWVQTGVLQWIRASFSIDGSFFPLEFDRLPQVSGILVGYVEFDVDLQCLMLRDSKGSVRLHLILDNQHDVCIMPLLASVENKDCILMSKKFTISAQCDSKEGIPCWCLLGDFTIVHKEGYSISCCCDEKIPSAFVAFRFQVVNRMWVKSRKGETEFCGEIKFLDDDSQKIGFCKVSKDVCWILNLLSPYFRHLYAIQIAKESLTQKGFSIKKCSFLQKFHIVPQKENLDCAYLPHLIEISDSIDFQDDCPKFIQLSNKVDGFRARIIRSSTNAVDPGFSKLLPHMLTAQIKGVATLTLQDLCFQDLKCECILLFQTRQEFPVCSGTVAEFRGFRWLVNPMNMNVFLFGTTGEVTVDFKLCTGTPFRPLKSTHIAEVALEVFVEMNRKFQYLLLPTLIHFRISALLSTNFDLQGAGLRITNVLLIDDGTSQALLNVDQNILVCHQPCARKVFSFISKFLKLRHTSKLTIHYDSSYSQSGYSKELESIKKELNFLRLDFGPRLFQGVCKLNSNELLKIWFKAIKTSQPFLSLLMVQDKTRAVEGQESGLKLPALTFEAVSIQKLNCMGRTNRICSMLESLELSESFLKE
jgi:hypothetical protein